MDNHDTENFEKMEDNNHRIYQRAKTIEIDVGKLFKFLI